MALVMLVTVLLIAGALGATASERLVGFSPSVSERATGAAFLGRGDGVAVGVSHDPDTSVPATGSVNSVVATVTLAEGAWDPMYDGSTGTIYVANEIDNNVDAISDLTNEVVATIPVGSGPVTPVYDPENGFLYVSDTDGSNVTVVSDILDSSVGSLAVGLYPGPGTYDPANGQVFVPSGADEAVTVLSGESVVTTISLNGVAAAQMTYDPANGYLYVPNSEGSNVSVIAGATDAYVGAVTVGTYPSTPLVDPATGAVYVANYDSNNVSVISPADRVIATVPVGSNPELPAFDAANGDIYVPNAGSSSVSVISSVSNTVIATVQVGAFPKTPLYDPLNGELYVANGYDGNVSVIDGTNNTVVATVPVATGPLAPALDSSTGDVWVTSFVAGLANVIAAGTGVAVVETGLKAGTSWSASLGGLDGAATGPAISFVVLPGEYSYSVTPVAGYAASTSSGIVIVGEQFYTIPVTFSSTALPVYTVTISETGLPAGTSWSAIFGGISGSSTTSSVTFTVTPGSYAYQVLPAGGDSASPSAGTVVVGGNYLISVTYVSSSSTSQVSVVGYSEGFTVAIAVAATALAFGIAAVLLSRRARPPATGGSPPGASI